MRNLSVLEETAVALPEGVRVLDLCVDAVESRTFVVAGDSTATAQLLTYDRAYLLTSTAVLPFAASERIAGMHFLMEREQVVVALESGDICTIDGSGAVDTVGTVDARIAAWRWSPDDEVLVLVTGEDRLLLMTADFDVLGESPLAAGQREDAPVSVGWGARETQYQGRDAQPEPESVSRLSGDDDMRVRVSWRGDAQFFAVSFVHQGARALRVFARDGRVHSEGEGAETLEHTLAWKPSGRLIAATARRAHRHEVVFFERNGLRHGEFALRAGTGRVRELSWNAESSVLAVVAETRDGACVQLWADKNYHWYLKQELRARDVVRAVWDAEEALRLTVVCARGFVRVQLHSAAAVAHAASLESNAAACVVDGARVLYTPFAHANVPPPMALHTLDAPMSVRHVAFAAFGAGNGFALLLADQRTVVLYECDAGKARPRELRYVELPADARARQVAWAERDVLVSLGAGGVSVTDVAAGSTRVCAGSAGMGLAVLAAAPLVGQVLAAGAGGRVYSVALDASEPWALAQLPAPCAEVDAADCGALGAVVVGRTARNQLYANSRLLSAACSSFFLRRDMLLFTTTTHCLRVAAADASLVTGAGAADGDGDEAAAGQGEARRRIERGAAIVLAAPAGDAVVFQMPRGNLETVRPRALVLAAVRRMLDAREYRRALIACRANRIDMNVLYDHAPAAFMADVDAFVAQVRECDLLNLFVSGLRDEDVTRTMYPGIGADRGARAAADSGDSAGKTTAVCRALRPVLQARADAARLLPTVLTTLVCERPPAIDEALGVIAALGADERDAALTHLLFLTDVGTVYDAALGRYDLALALRVAERSQRDPREYLPELRALRALESEELRRFTIDAQLRRPARALGHLCAAFAEGACAWDALVAYVDEHALHRECLALLAGHARAPDMHVAYGDALARDKQWAQAAAAYMLSQRAHAQAVDALVAGRQWQLALALAAAPGSGFGAQRV
ncbi:putative elongator complex protein 1, partial [Coemansia sp. RSA 2704]